MDLPNRQWAKAFSPFGVDVPPCVNADWITVDCPSTEGDDRHIEGNVPTILVHALGLFSDDSMLDWHYHHSKMEAGTAKMEPYPAGCDGHRCFLFLMDTAKSS